MGEGVKERKSPGQLLRLFFSAGTKKQSKSRRVLSDEDFKKLTLEDRVRVRELASADGGMGDHLHFTTMYLAQYMYDDGFVEYGNCLIKKPWREEGMVHCQYPIGAPLDRKAAARALYEQYASTEKSFSFFAVSQEELTELREIFGAENIAAQMDEANRNYIYSAAEQIWLQGPQFHDRRSRLSRFRKKWDWCYEAMSKDNLDECREVNAVWYARRAGNSGVDEEQIALKIALDNFDRLGLQGGIIRIAGRVAGFCIGEPFNEKIFLMHFQKSDFEIKDLVMLLLNEFFAHNCADYCYINYEEDMGAEGLRRFKSAMHPVFLTEFYHVQIIEKTK